MDEVVTSETEFAFVAYRTQLFNPGDIDKVKATQAGYKAQTLSAFLGQAAPSGTSNDLKKPSTDAPEAVLETQPATVVKPLTQEVEKSSLEFFQILNAVLSFAPAPPEETDLRARFAKIGVGGDQTFDPDRMSDDMKTAIQGGMADAWTAYADFKKTKIDTSEVTSGDILGSRKDIDGRWIYRMSGTIAGIYGNSKVEAMYPMMTLDNEGKPFDGANKYTLTFEKDAFPPANAFWSVTMYNFPQSLLVDNSINRYLINSPMMDGMKKNDDGSLTIYIQNESPGKDLEANWLPAPAKGFWMPIRIYWPKDESLNGDWKAPTVQRVSN